MVAFVYFLVAVALSLANDLGMVSAAEPDYVSKCTTRLFEQPKDHFSFRPGKPTFKQRVLFNLDSFKPNGPIFFYLGNEADVELYVDHTGLIWENAEAFGAAVVFAEHRYYGKSRVFDDDKCDMSLLTTEQALADYAIIVDFLKAEWKASAVIGFGGSYGGMLSTVFRYQYPHIVDGVIAASAPVLAYQGLTPPYDPNGFARVVTRDAGEKCAKAVKTGLKQMFDGRSSKDFRTKLKTTFGLCKSLDDENDVVDLISLTSSAWDYLAMGDFPYPSRYVQPEGGMLPAYPVKAACVLVLAASDPVEGLARAAEMFYNATGSHSCLFSSSPPRLVTPRAAVHRRGSLAAQSRSCEGDWDWQWCTEHNMPFTSGTDADMFYPPTGPFDLEEAKKTCKSNWGIEPNPLWARLTYGGLQGLQSQLTNVVFSNGLLDPWSAGGVLTNNGFDPSVVTVHIPHGAHHIDLMFSHKGDPIDVKLARAVELMHIAKWILEAKQRQRHAKGYGTDHVVSIEKRA